MDVNALADSYFKAIRARDIDALIALYADDATFTLPNGKEIVSAPAIRAFQLQVFESGAPYPTPGARIAGENGIAVEIEAKMPDGNIRRTANFFHLNADGRIRHLSVYARG